jgi:hypothetical protein
MFFGVSRNNIFAVSGSGIRDPFTPDVCDYDYDLFSRPWGGAGDYTVARSMESHGLTQDAGFLHAGSGDFRLATASPARGSGVRIPGMNGFQPGATVDLGALPSQGHRAVPWRPVSVRAVPAQVDFRGSRSQTMARPIQVQLDTDQLAQPLPFSIAMNSETDWLRVDPASGVLHPGEPLTLQVSLTERIAAREKPTVGAFLVRFESGSAIPVTAYADVRSHDIRVVAEAESLTGADAFPSASDVHASGGKYLEFQVNADRNRALLFEVEIPETGWYSVSFRVRCPEPLGQHDSVTLAIDEGPPQPLSLKVIRQKWHWAIQANDSGALTRLEQGRRRLHVRPRESLSLDAIQLRGSQLPLAERGR